MLLVLAVYGGFVAGGLSWYGPYVLGGLGGAGFAGAVYAAVLALAGLLQVVGGAAADVVGRRRVVAVAQALRLVATAPAALLGVNAATAAVLVVGLELSRFLGARQPPR